MTEQELRDGLSEFGDRLRTLIDRSGMTMKEFAVRCDMHYNTVKTMVHGHRYPTLWTLMKIHEALGCTWDELLGERHD